MIYAGVPQVSGVLTIPRSNLDGLVARKIVTLTRQSKDRGGDIDLSLDAVLV
jgi:hypothetical protein